MAVDDRAWRKSSYSHQETNCVEVAQLPGATAVRDSKHPETDELRVTAREWQALVRAIRSGRL